MVAVAPAVPDGTGVAEAVSVGEAVSDGVAEGGQLGVNSTPTIFINGRRLSGAQPYEVFAQMIDEELSRK